ncbi:MAG: alpha/beta-type small acid-soluble spore protein [Firmicutes bacterium]|nr:alpha/beta-type small acid-soluble spore protein [Bacillota bacterium]MCL5972110.1 alpha/beta-type small acid-soluble spore protein [Bacillota bacterium]
MAEDKKTVRRFSQERFQQEVARELGIDLNADEGNRPERAFKKTPVVINDPDQG